MQNKDTHIPASCCCDSEVDLLFSAVNSLCIVCVAYYLLER